LSSPQEAKLMVTLDPLDGYTVLINTFHVKPGQADALAAALQAATERTIQHADGFISANVHVSEDGARVINYAQWRSKTAYEAMLKDPQSQAHFEEAQALSESFDPVLCELRYSHTGEEDWRA
jgi:quinol monooxygenase YgiN